MPSLMPLLSYEVYSQDDHISTPSSLSSQGNAQKATVKVVERKESKTSGEIGDGGFKYEQSPKEGKKMTKKKKRAAGKVPSRKDAPSSAGATDKVGNEELLPKATAQAQAIQAVKMAVLEIQLFLLDGVNDKAQLQGTSPLLTQSEYSDVVTERSISKVCGYPLCKNELIPPQKRKGRYRISLREHKVYDQSETGLFCCADCLIASKTFQSSLQIDRDDLFGKEKLRSIMDYIRDPKTAKNRDDASKDHQNGTVPSNGSLVSGIQEREDSGVSSFDNAGPFDAIEGYVPQKSTKQLRLEKIAHESVEVDLERVATGNEAALSVRSSSKQAFLDKGKSRDELKEEAAPVPILKSALKKGDTKSFIKRSVSWGDQKQKDQKSERRDQKSERKDQKSERKDQRSSPRLKERHKTRSYIPPAADPPISRGTSVATGTTTAGSSVVVTSNAEPAKDKTSSPVHEQIGGSCVLVTSSADPEKDKTSSPVLHEKIGGSSVLVTSSADPAEEKTRSAVLHGQIGDSSVLVSSMVDTGDTAEGRSNRGVPVKDSETQKSDRLLAAQAVAAALMEAAEAAAGGEIGSVEAAARAGLSINPVTESMKESGPFNMPSEDSSNETDESPGSSTASPTEVDVRWPRVESQDEDDLDLTSARGGWHDVAPKNFKVEVSMFGTIWMALEEWISAATIAHIYGKEPQDQDDFVVANGREFRRQVHVEGTTSAEISKTFSLCISRAFPDVVQALRLNVPMSTLEQALGRLVRTMTFMDALPAFGSKHWSMITTLLLDGLSVRRLPAVGVHLANNMSLLRKFLESKGTSEAEYDTFRGLLLPLGRLPTFSTMSGG